MKTGRKEEVNMNIKVGLVGTSQLSFAGPKQEVYAKIIDQMKKNSAEMNFDLVIWPEQIISKPDAKRAVDFMEGEKIDFLLILNISYSLEHPVIGLDAMNVAPEFGLVETEALLELAQIEEKFTAPYKRSNIRSIIAEHAVRGERWRKWMVGEKRTASVDEIMKDAEDLNLITKMCGHYTLEDNKVKEAVACLNRNIADLGLKPERYVIKKIKDSIDRYIYCFNLYGVTDEILAKV